MIAGSEERGFQLKPANRERRRIALVTPWFGPQLRGGAEQQAWQLAVRLARRAHAIEVLTTCCRSFLESWSENHLAPGVSNEDGIVVRRFPVSGRNQEAFERLNAELLATPRTDLRPGVSPVTPERSAIWARENINSEQLECHLSDRHAEFDDFIFMPYLYGTTLNGLPLVADKAWLLPCLHDEVYAYLPDVTSAVYQAKGLMFISDGEAEVAARIFGPVAWAKGSVVGAGVELGSLDQSGADVASVGIQGKPYLLCLGRRDSGKGVDLLVDAFVAFKQASPASELMLVLAGPGATDYANPEYAIVDLGLVTESVKLSLLRGCRAICQPSTNESFSRVLFEAWRCGKPAIAHRDCLATHIAVEKSRGGWLAGSSAEWSDLLATVDRSSAYQLSEVGERGKRYAEKIADWEIVISRIESVLHRQTSDKKQSVAITVKERAIHQLLPGLAFGDAISIQALFIRDELRSRGFESEIFAGNSDPRVRDECRRFTPVAIGKDDGLIYHHSIGSELTSFAAGHSGPKCLVYHNITPAEFFAAYRPELATLLRKGRDQMWNLAPAFELSVGDSRFNANEVELFGFHNPAVLPLVIDPARWDQPPDSIAMADLQDGVRNLLFVGRMSPNKCQHQLVEAFGHYRDIEESRLILVGESRPHDPYLEYVRTRIDDLGLRRHVRVVGHCSTEQLQAYYRTAHLFWCMSEHEGLCVPLIEAMWFDVPVFGFRSTVIPETLGAAGAMFDSKTDLAPVAQIAHQIASDGHRRQELLRGQRLRRQDFTRDAVRPQLHGLVDALSG